VPGARQLGYHLPHSLLPAELADLPVLGFVRNPWSYYVSWYAFQSARAQPNPLFRVLSEDGTAGFNRTIANMLDLGADDARLEAVTAALPASYTNRGLNLPGFALAPIRGSALGFYAYLFEYIFAGARRLEVGRMEALRSDLTDLLERVGEPVHDALRRHVATAAPVNTSKHGDYAGYYDAALRDRVAERDATIIERFGYRFGD
jgi:hypothetical protein